MKLARGLLWLLVLAFVALLTISSVLSLTDVEPKDAGMADDWEEGGWEDDYGGDEGEMEPEYGQQPPPSPYNQMPPPPPSNYAPQSPPQYPPPPPPVNYEPQPQYVASPPPAPYQPVQVQPYQPAQAQPYQTPQAPAYPQQQVVEYQQNYTFVELYPLPAQPAYQPQPQVAYQQANYSVPQPAAYQQSYSAPAPQPQMAYQPTNYTAPPPQPQMVYQPANYSAPPPPPPPQPKPQAYQSPPPPPPPPKAAYQPANYTAPQPKPPVYQPPPPVAYKPAYSGVPAAKPTYNQQPAYPMKPANYSVGPYKAPQYTASSLARKYSLSDLAQFVTPFGYRGNHWTQNYYRNSEYQTQVCPKQAYGARGPSYKDVEEAFAFALFRLGYHNKDSIQYLNPNTPSFAARHQISSYLTQKNARMDEEGYLVEFVSHYLADRLCMTKWNKQRYLPSLTRFVSSSQFPSSHACSQYHSNAKYQQWQWKNCHANKYRTYDGFCNNPWHPYWGKANVCHIRLLSPDYADGISRPRESNNKRHMLPNARLVANVVHNDVPLDGPYNLMKMQWGQFVNHDITNTALSAFDGLVDCCKQPDVRGCWAITVPAGDSFYGPLNVTCLNFIRSGVCPTCQLGPRQQTNKNTAFLDMSQVYGNNQEQAMQLRTFVGGLLKTSMAKNGEHVLPMSSAPEQCVGHCYQAGDSRANQHPALTSLHVMLVRNHNRHAQALGKRHPNWNDETLFQEARRLSIAEYQMVTYGEYMPIIFGPVLTAYYHLTPKYSGYTQYDPKVDPTTWNEYATAACRFGHSQISSTYIMTNKVLAYGQSEQNHSSYRIKDWYFRPSMMGDGMCSQIVNGLLSSPSGAVDPWMANDVRNWLYRPLQERYGGDLAATNIMRGRDHGIAGYVHYVEYCFNYKVRGWKDLQLFIPQYTLNQLRKLYKVVENIDLFTGGLSERHFPGADIGPTFACINGIQYYHAKMGDRYYFEHGGQAGSFSPAQLDELRRSTLARLLCRSANLQTVPQFAFLQASMYNPLVNCSQVGDVNYNLF